MNVLYTLFRQKQRVIQNDKHQSGDQVYQGMFEKNNA